MTATLRCHICRTPIEPDKTCWHYGVDRESGLLDLADYLQGVPPKPYCCDCSALLLDAANGRRSR